MGLELIQAIHLGWIEQKDRVWAMCLSPSRNTGLSCFWFKLRLLELVPSALLAEASSQVPLSTPASHIRRHYFLPAGRTGWSQWPHPSQQNRLLTVPRLLWCNALGVLRTGASLLAFKNRTKMTFSLLPLSFLGSPSGKKGGLEGCKGGNVWGAQKNLWGSMADKLGSGTALSGDLSMNHRSETWH